MTSKSAAPLGDDPSVYINEALCTGCGACVNSCPIDVFRCDPVTGKAIVVYPRDCCFCFLCQGDCPTGAVAVDHNAGNPRLPSIYDLMNIEIPDWN